MSSIECGCEWCGNSESASSCVGLLARIRAAGWKPVFINDGIQWRCPTCSDDDSEIQKAHLELEYGH